MEGDGAGQLDLSERFRIAARLGAGGMGVVYRVYDAIRQQEVALKVMREFEPMALYRFKQEFRTLADIRHPNLVTLYELLSADDRWFFTMELIDGGDFVTYVRGDDAPAPVTDAPPQFDVRQCDGTTQTMKLPVRPARADAGPLPGAAVPRLRAALEQLIDGVVALHDSGHLHRDIKPSNVLVDTGGRLVLLDFGVATEVRPGGVTLRGEEVVGTPAYIAPEVGTGTRIYEASDWYSVGALLYETIAGRRPFSGDVQRVLDQKRAFDPPPLTELAPDAPADLVELITRLLARDPAARPTAAEIMRAIGRAPDRGSGSSSGSAQLYGRTRHIESLDAAFEDVREGRARLVRVRGASGMGKTELVDRFVTGLQGAREAVTLIGRCYVRESVPYKALDSLVDALLRHLLDFPAVELERVLPRDIHLLARVFPVLRRLESAVPVPWLSAVTPDPHELRRRAVAAFRELLTALRRIAPVVIWIDDVQWGDSESAAILGELLEGSGAPPILVILAYRADDEECPFLDALSVDPAIETSIPVTRLAMAEARDLAASLLGDGDDDGDRAERIARESGGNPFFVRALVRHHVAGGADVGLDELLAGWLDELDDDARAMIGLIAVAARPIVVPVLVRAAELGARGRTAVDLLVASRLVRAKGRSGREQVECYHDKVREAAYASLDDAALEDAHRRLARAMLAEERADHEAIATHLEHAGEVQWAAEHYLRAADEAAAQLASDRAVALYRHALALRPLEGRAESEVLHKLADTLCAAGLGGQSVEVYRAAAVHADAADALVCHGRAIEELLRDGRIPAAVEAMREFLPTVGLSVPRRPTLALALSRVRLRLRGYRFEPRPHTEITAAQRMMLETCWSASTSLGLSQHLLGAVFQTRYTLESLRIGDPVHVARSLGVEGIYVALRGIHARGRALAIVERARAIIADHPDPMSDVLLDAGEVLVRYQFCEWRDCLPLAIGAERTLADYLATRWSNNTMELYILWCLYYLGEIGELEARARRVLRRARDRGDRYAVTNVCCGLQAMGWLARDRPDESRALWSEAIAAWSDESYYLQHYWQFQSTVQDALYRGDPEAALRAVDDHWKRLERAYLLYIQFARVEAVHFRARATLAAVAAEVAPPSALARVDRISRALEREGTLLADVSALLQRAATAHLRGDDERARELLARAATDADAAGMTMHAAAARYRLAALGGDADAGAWIEAEGVRDPARFFAVIAPGL